MEVKALVQSCAENRSCTKHHESSEDGVTNPMAGVRDDQQKLQRGGDI